ncbi:hypothetical protein Mal15_41780 [Stieleria maiorica]|uniref:Fibronectin type-III domain-containing protein n=1 Tax=Stieleria maiorica TaxID=2795974 RepID=A0A5B9MG16_9BACT|nr:hypothetical protein [Stieleria maiorica]QEG00109.1 hypothetical protein Mal15_41780 [Stieleria maiorica]
MVIPVGRRAVTAALFIGIIAATFSSVAMADEHESASPPVLSFVETELGESREGYFTLEWSAVDGAALYRVRDSANEIAYEGIATKSFQSGLSDGSYLYRVEAIGEDGQTIAISDEATATVRHWGLVPSLTLFAIGAVVVAGIVFVILRGRTVELRLLRQDAARLSDASRLQSMVEPGHVE